MTKHALATAAAAVALAAAGARADELRNVRPGEAVPPFALPTLEGGELGLADWQGKAVILVFLSAHQRSSEAAAAAAHDVWHRLRRDDLVLAYATADTAQAPYFRRLRDAAGLHEPLLLDFDYTLYGKLGLIVLPTTVVIDGEGRLAHVIASKKGDYAHVLEAYAEHAAGAIDGEELQRRLAARQFRRDRPEDRIERHRAAARILRESDLPADAEKELRRALQIDPQDIGTQLDLASLALATDRVNEARELVEAVLKREPNHRRGRLIHGVVLYRLGRLDEAARVLEETLLLNPDPVQTHYYLGRIHQDKGDAAKALEHYRKSLTRALADRPL